MCIFRADALLLFSGCGVANRVTRPTVPKYFLEPSHQDTASGPAKPLGRVTRGRYTLAGAFVATAIAGTGIYYASADFPLQMVKTNEAAFQSPAYQFGFAHAALAGCNFAPGAELDRLGVAVQADSRGILSADVKTGFGDFHNLREANGAADACKQAERFFGPRARLRPGVLMPR